MTADALTYDKAKQQLGKNDGWSMWFPHASLQRRSHGVIGLFNWCGSDIMRFHKNGEIRVRIKPLLGSDIIRINYFMPYAWVIWRLRGKVLIGKEVGNGHVIKGKTLVFRADGTFTNKLGESHDVLKKRMSHKDYLRSKPRRRGQYWTARASNLYADRSKCKFRGGTYWLCNIRRGGRGNEPRTFECGCRTYRKNIKFTGAVEKIMAEKNATVRTAMIKLYGISKFFTEAKSNTIHRHNGYELLDLSLADAEPALDPWGRPIPIAPIRALKMKCPSTGEVYVNTVPSNITTVSDSLDWIFDTRNFLQTVGQQT